MMPEQREQLISEVVKGNGDKFTVKEILLAHIADGKGFESFIRKEFAKLGKAIDENTTNDKVNMQKVKSLSRVVRFGVAPLLLMIIAYLLGTKFIP